MCRATLYGDIKVPEPLALGIKAVVSDNKFEASTPEKEEGPKPQRLDRPHF